MGLTDPDYSQEKREYKGLCGLSKIELDNGT